MLLQVPDLKATHLQTNLTDVDIGVCKYGFPQYTPYRQRVSQELQVYFTPSNNQGTMGSCLCTQRFMQRNT